MSESVNIEYVAKLARLRISPSEKDKMRENINATLGMFEQIMEISNLKELSRGLRRSVKTSELRKDKIVDKNDPESLTDYAPEVDNCYFVVPLTVAEKGTLEDLGEE